MLNIENLLKELANENGEVNINNINFEDLNKKIVDTNEAAVDELAQVKAGKIISAERQKMKKNTEEKINELNNIKNNNDELLNQFLEKLSNVENELASVKKNEKLNNFKRKLKDNNISNDVIDMLVSSGADVDAIDIDVLKGFKNADINVKDTSIDEQPDEQVDNDKTKFSLSDIKKKLNTNGIGFTKK